MDTRRFLLDRVIPATALILILILASSYAAAQTSPAVSKTAGAIVLAQADADDDSALETTVTERRAPSWRPQAPIRPDVSSMPPPLERPEFQYEVARPTVNLPILDLGSETLVALPPSESGDDAADAETAAIDAGKSAVAGEEVAAEDSGPAETQQVTEVAAAADSPEIAELQDENSAVAAQSSELQSSDQEVAIANSNEPLPIVDDSVAENEVQIDQLDEPPVELATAALLPQTNEPVLPEFQTDPDVNSAARDDSASDNNADITQAVNSAPASALVATRWVRPTYPRGAYRQGREGWVQLRITVDPAGQVTDIALIDSQPRAVFVREAVRAANQWEFEPLAASLPQVNRTKIYQIDFTLGD